MIQHASPISGIDASEGLIATAGYDNRVILWDAATRTALAEGRHDHLANQCRFSASGKLLATSGSDYPARVWAIPDLRQLMTNNPSKIEALGRHGIDVVRRVPLRGFVTVCNREYLLTKENAMGHLTDND